MKIIKLSIDTNCRFIKLKKQRSQSPKELRPKMNLTQTKKPINAGSYLLIVSVEPETEVL
jgi:hypothetical protein